MRDHRRFLNVRRRADNLVGFRLVDDQTNPFKLDFPTVAPADLAEELCEDLDKQDISAEVKGFMYNTSAKPSSGLVERIIKYMNDFGGMEPLARDLSEEDPTDVDTENASTITVAWEDGEYVERLDTLATAC